MKVQSREAYVREYGNHDLGFNARFLDLLHAFHRFFFFPGAPERGWFSYNQCLR